MCKIVHMGEFPIESLSLPLNGFVYFSERKKKSIKPPILLVRKSQIPIEKVTRK